MSHVTAIAEVDIADLARWIGGVPLDAWPQQPGTVLRPAMVTDLEWQGFGRRTDDLVHQVMMHLDRGTVAYLRMLSAVMPGHSITPHADHQLAGWIGRVHIPLVSNDAAVFVVGGEIHWLEPGIAYLVDVSVEHSVENKGETPRIHFMFDVTLDGAGGVLARHMIRQGIRRRDGG